MFKKNKEYCKKVKEITEFGNTDTINHFCNKWEFVKYKITEFSIKFSKDIIKERKQEEINLLKETSQCCSEAELSSNNTEKRMSLQSKLDDMAYQKLTMYLKKCASQI